MSEWFGTLDGLWGEAWSQIGEGVRDAKHPARLVSFSTVSKDQRPQSRTVVLRRTDPEEAVCEVHTDIESTKIAEIEEHPLAALLWWLPHCDLQVRMLAEVSILSGDTVNSEWEKVPVSSRISYGTEPAPGLPIEAALAYTKPAVRERFCVLRCCIEQIDLTYLGQHHRRAEFTRLRDWKGQWLSP